MEDHASVSSSIRLSIFSLKQIFFHQLTLALPQHPIDSSSRSNSYQPNSDTKRQQIYLSSYYIMFNIYFFIQYKISLLTLNIYIYTNKKNCNYIVAIGDSKLSISNRY